MGAKFWLGLVGIAVGAVIAGSVFAILFGWVWASWGFFGALVILTAILVGFGYLYDRRAANRRKRLAA